MEKSIVSTGKTIDLAIDAALSQLGLDRDSVSVQVLQKEKAGFLGFGAQMAKVQVTYEVADPEPSAPAAKSALGSASRSKPRPAAAPVKKPEAPKAAVNKALSQTHSACHPQRTQRGHSDPAFRCGRRDQRLTYLRPEDLQGRSAGYAPPGRRTEKRSGGVIWQT